MSSDSHGFRQIVVIITYQHNIILFCLSPTLLNRTNYRQNMVNLHYTNNYEEFTSLMKTLDEAKQQTFIVFTGTTNEIGQSWCSDCVEAEPVIQKQVELNEERLKDANLVYAQVGKREEWKNNNENPFKLDKKIRLQFLPTLLRWGTLHKLQVEECLKPDLLDMIFED